MPDALHLVKVPLRPDRLMAVARSRFLSLRDVDEGYLCHCITRALWQERAPAPFVIRSQGRTLELWGYTNTDASALVEHARAFGDPSLVAVIADVGGIASKEMPPFQAGRRLGFLLRGCPIVRLARTTNGHDAGAEVDAFLARCFALGRDADVSREQVYRDWIAARVNDVGTTGARLDWVRVTGISRERLVRRTQGSERKVKRLDRPDVHFEGELIVSDGERFLGWLGHGVGRHRAFGFGAVILVPPRRAAES